MKIVRFEMTFYKVEDAEEIKDLIVAKYGRGILDSLRIMEEVVRNGS